MQEENNAKNVRNAKNVKKSPAILKLSTLPLVLLLLVVFNNFATYRIFLSHGEIDEEDLIEIHHKEHHELNILEIPPEGEPPNLPSLETMLEDDKHAKDVKRLRNRLEYGGKGDAKHLGGFTAV